MSTSHKHISHSSEFAAILDALSAEDLPHLKHLGRRERRAAETRVRLFRSAVQLFAKRGFSDVTVEDITDAADVGKGTFFNYFESKEHVLGVMPEIQLGKVRHALAQAESGEQSIHTIMRRLFYRICEEPARSADLMRALISCAMVSEKVRTMMSDRMAEGRKLLARIFEIGQQRGEIASGLKPANLAFSCQQTIMGTLLLWCLRGETRIEDSLGPSFNHFWRAVSSSHESVS